MSLMKINLYRSSRSGPVRGFSVGSREQNNQRIWASLSFIFVIIVLGIPMWWKTTQVYRATLPYNGIKMLSSDPIEIVSNIGIFTSSPERSSLLIDEMNEFFAKSIVNVRFYAIVLDEGDAQGARTPASLEAIVLRKYVVAAGDFVFIEWKKMDEEILVTSERTALIAKDATSTKIQQVLRSWILQEHKLRLILANNDTNKRDPRVRQTTLVPFPNYDILISVLNPKPSSQNVKWNVRHASDAYITPFLRKINVLSKFTVKSQWIYQVPFEFPSKQVPDNTTLGRHYALPQEHLPHIITSIERKLGNPISDNPCLHLVVYVPPCENGPLHIYNQLGQWSNVDKVDSFLSPKWGGIVIANPPEDICRQAMDTQERVEFTLKSEGVMQVMLYLLRRLVDIQNDIQISRASIVPLESVEPRAYEIDSYLRCGIVHLINSATLTLQSLIQLLDGISNIVINDEVGVVVNEAYENIILAKRYLRQNDITNATIFAKAAFVAAETAFYYPSMLALLYFPDDQKYAIYIPLFLPIMIPVFFSIIAIAKFFLKKDDKVEDKEKAE